MLGCTSTAVSRGFIRLCSSRSFHDITAFGAFARVVPELAHFAKGLEFADSITGDGRHF
jgi:hypothetical protein